MEFKGSLLIVLWAALCLARSTPVRDGMKESTSGGKLIYILMDGFRWDYVDQQESESLPGFTKFLKEGVKSRWLNPLFPSLSYPTWTSLVTGRYAESHGIVGNYFYDSQAKDPFSLFDSESTGQEKWWTSEPIWTTAERAGLRTAQFLWARCDVPINGVTTQYCEKFVKIPGKEIFVTNINKALQKLDEGFDFIQVYTEHTDHAGHNYGPDSEEVQRAVRDLDDVLMMLMDGLEERGMTDDVNIVIVSDHGMTDTTPGKVTRHEVDDYLDPGLVENIADKGAMMNLKVPEENVQQVYDQLSQMSGVHVYKHDDIPERYHYKNNKYIHEVVVAAELGNMVMASHSDKQLPLRNDFVYYGLHGYDGSYEDMRGIFFAKGPAFQKDRIIEPIHVVDVYQVLANVLGVSPQPHNGTWSKVESAFTSSALTNHDHMEHDDHTEHDHDHSHDHGTQNPDAYDHDSTGGHDKQPSTDDDSGSSTVHVSSLLSLALLMVHL